MDLLTDNEIYNASEAIDDAFAIMTKDNRGKTARTILKSVRDLNDHIAYKVWHDINPNKNMGLQKVAKQMGGKYRFISRFDNFLRASVSHFTPSEDGAERLLIKYYKYLIQLKKLVWDRYKMVILKNINCFVDDTDTKTKEYYSKVAESISGINEYTSHSDLDNYYVDRIKPFFINNDVYYEVTLEPATNKPNKFQRITAFTQYDIFDNYSVALSFADREINIFDTQYPIKIIYDWNVSIRPCELENFADLLGMEVKVQRRDGDYSKLMSIITNNQLSLVDLIDLPDDEYEKFKKEMNSAAKNKKSAIINILNHCRYISKRNYRGTNIIRYLLYRLNNKVIKDQRPTTFNPQTLGNFNFSSKCLPFDEHPFSHYPKDHVTSLFDLYQCIDASNHKPELLKRFIDNNTYSNHVLFTPIEDIFGFGDKDEIIQLANQYNDELYEGFRPSGEIDQYKDHLFVKAYEEGVFNILTELKALSEESSEISEEFSEAAVEQLENLSDEDKLDDPLKKKILENMFSLSRVHCVYGAAGTGKTTLVNHISYLLRDKKRAFVAKTHPAVENLRRKVKHQNELDEFITIDQFTKKSKYAYQEYDMVVVDECSTVRNEEIKKVISRLGQAVLILMGDTYQIESIGFGNWFSLIKETMPSYCCHELITPYRSTDENLKSLWNEVRNMTDENIALEKMVRNSYSHIIDEDIFKKRSEDEIILCLNYNGLYGLNNINKLLQLSNPNKAVTIGVWQFKKGDPILFNDSERFSCLYNNLKGRIIDIKDDVENVYFIIEVDIELHEKRVKSELGLKFISCENGKTKIGFVVARLKPYSSDKEETTSFHIIPFQIAYAVSIHKSQGLEYDSVKIVIADESEERINHNIFYTAITRARKHLTIYWSHEVCNRILSRIRPTNSNKDYMLLKSKRNM